MAGGEFVDLGTFVGDPPEHIDPALNSTLDAYQVINAVYDGLTDIDATDPDNPQIVPHLAESFEANDDAIVWTFTIRDGQAFAGARRSFPAPSRRPGSAPPPSPVTTATSSPSSKVARRPSTRQRPHHLRCRRGRRGHDPRGHALRPVLELPRSRRLPALHAGARRSDRGRSRVGERHHVRQRPLRDGEARTDQLITSRRTTRGPATTTTTPGTTVSTPSTSSPPPTRTPRTTRSRPARATTPTSRPVGSRRRRTTTPPPSTWRSSGRTTS